MGILAVLLTSESGSKRISLKALSISFTVGSSFFTRCISNGGLVRFLCSKYFLIVVTTTSAQIETGKLNIPELTAGMATKENLCSSAHVMMFKIPLVKSFFAWDIMCTVGSFCRHGPTK